MLSHIIYFGVSLFVKSLIILWLQHVMCMRKCGYLLRNRVVSPTFPSASSVFIYWYLLRGAHNEGGMSSLMGRCPMGHKGLKWGSPQCVRSSHQGREWVSLSPAGHVSLFSRSLLLPPGTGCSYQSLTFWHTITHHLRIWFFLKESLGTRGLPNIDACFRVSIYTKLYYFSLT